MMIEIKEKKPITSGVSSRHITKLKQCILLDAYDDRNQRNEAYYERC